MKALTREILWTPCPACGAAGGQNCMRGGKRAVRFVHNARGATGERIYLIETLEGRHRVKVGFSTNIEARFAELNTSSPVALSIRAVWAACRAFEERAHLAVEAYWVKGEWFRGEAAPLVERFMDARTRRVSPEFDPISTSPPIGKPMTESVRHHPDDLLGRCRNNRSDGSGRAESGGASLVGSPRDPSLDPLSDSRAEKMTGWAHG